MVSISGCQTTIVKGPDCVILTEKVFCIDTRLEEEDPNREYEIPIIEARGWTTVPPWYRKELQKQMLDLIEENEILKRRQCDEYNSF